MQAVRIVMTFFFLNYSLISRHYVNSLFVFSLVTTRGLNFSQCSDFVRTDTRTVSENN